MEARRVIPCLKAADRWAAIAELVEQLIVSEQIPAASREQVIESIRKRENSRSTGIGSGIAIPHARTDLVADVAWAFGRSRCGIGFEGFDDQPVKFIFLFLVPESHFERHIQTLARIARAFKGDQVFRDLSAAPDAEAIMKVLQSRL